MRLTGWVVLLAMVGSTAAAAADSSLVLGAGRFGLKSKDDADVVVDVEYRGPKWPRLWGVYPTAGVFVTDSEAAHLRLGFGRDFELNERWRLTLTTAAGAYEQGDAKDLGHTIEFRSALELSFQLQTARLGLSISHLSNASISDSNPGIEVALVTLTLPLGPRSRS